VPAALKNKKGGEAWTIWHPKTIQLAKAEKEGGISDNRGEFSTPKIYPIGMLENLEVLVVHPLGFPKIQGYRHADDVVVIHARWMRRLNKKKRLVELVDGWKYLVAKINVDRRVGRTITISAR
jgi:hypothetical protein